MDTALDPDLIARFRAEIERADLAGQRIGLAVSGGPDSLALLLLANAVQPELIEAATVDHGLRPESAEEAQFVAGICAKLGVPHAVLRVEVPAGNLQDRARITRYEALGRWHEERKLAAVMTAHHVDDQAETLLMRLNRGSGLRGLAGIRAWTEIPGWRGQLFRPLLDWRKEDLEKIVADCDIDPVQDPSNLDDRFDRARIRKALADADWIDVEGIARSASLLADAEAALHYYAELEWCARVSEKNDEIIYTPQIGKPRELHLRIVDRAIRQLGGTPRLSQVSDLCASLSRGEGGNLAGVLARARGEEWLFTPEPSRNL